MLNDIYQEPFKVDLGGKQYLLEFNHAAYAAFEKRVQKSIYEIYDNLISKKSLMFNESVSMVISAMLKNYSVREINETEEFLQNYPGVWHDIKDVVTTAFLVPLLPPKAIEKIELGTKKKERTKKKEITKK